MSSDQKATQTAVFIVALAANYFFPTFVLHIASGRFVCYTRLRSTREPDLGNTSVGNAGNVLGHAHSESSIFYCQEMLLFLF